MTSIPNSSLGQMAQKVARDQNSKIDGLSIIVAINTKINPIRHCKVVISVCFSDNNELVRYVWADMAGF
jgi:hypothetical protein